MHLAFYSGWENAMSAVPLADEVFARRGIKVDDLDKPLPKFACLNEAAEAERAAMLNSNSALGARRCMSTRLRFLFRELWLRPALAPRDRSLVTVSALVASGQVAQMAYHLIRAMDNGLTQTEASEALNRLAFYAGWPQCLLGLAVAKEVFSKRAEG